MSARAKKAPTATPEQASPRAPRAPRRLKAVAARSEAQVKWEARERELRASKMGVTVQVLADAEDLSEDWQQDAPILRTDAGVEFAGLYLLKNGHLSVARLGREPVRAGRKVRLTANEGRDATESGVGVRIGD